MIRRAATVVVGILGLLMLASAMPTFIDQTFGTVPPSELSQATAALLVGLLLSGTAVYIQPE